MIWLQLHEEYYDEFLLSQRGLSKNSSIKSEYENSRFSPTICSLTHIKLASCPSEITNPEKSETCFISLQKQKFMDSIWSKLGEMQKCVYNCLLLHRYFCVDEVYTSR